MRGVSLRVRLVAALAVLLVVGLSLFGFAAYSVYARLQHDRLDESLQAALPIAARRLQDDDDRQPQTPPPSSGDEGFGGEGFPDRPAPAETYAVLLAADGTVVRGGNTFSTAKPDLPAELQPGRHYVDLMS